METMSFLTHENQRTYKTLHISEIISLMKDNGMFQRKTKGLKPRKHLVKAY